VAERLVRFRAVLGGRSRRSGFPHPPVRTLLPVVLLLLDSHCPPPAGWRFNDFRRLAGLPNCRYFNRNSAGL
jgi:hypothetical protein